MDRILGFFDQAMLIDMGLQIVNTCIMCAVLAYFLYKPVKEFLRKRAERIQSQIESAEKDYNDAKKAKVEYDKALLEIDKERVQILEVARKQAQEKEAQIIAEAKVEATSIKNRAMQEIALEQERVKDDMKKQLVELSTAVASRFIVTSLDADSQNKLIDKAIAELGDATWRA